MDKDFVEWMTEEQDKRGWDDAELSRRAEVHQSTISTIRSRTKRCGYKTARGLAKAFGYEDEFVMQLAGLIPPSKKPEDATVSEWEAVGRQLTNAERVELIEWALAKIAKRLRGQS